jgi:hypothetical protein
MASFLDNSGDIILDAVLTDIGRQRLAKADGSFTITAFSFGDDEINYKLYDTNASTAAKDLNILKSPVFEAFTNASTAVQYNLITLQGKDQTLFLPVAKLNTNTPTGPFPGFPYASSDDNGGTANQFVVLANQLAVDKYIGDGVTGSGLPNGFINGVTPEEASTDRITVDQGLDTTQLSFKTVLDQDLNEDTYLAEVDDRLLKVVSPGGTPAVESFIDTDSIATYVLSNQGNVQYFSGGASGQSAQFGQSPIKGPRGSIFRLSFYASPTVASSDYLFDQFGQTKTGYFPDSTNAKVIDAVVRLRGNKAGITIDIPVRIVRAVS